MKNTKELVISRLSLAEEFSGYQEKLELMEVGQEFASGKYTFKKTADDAVLVTENNEITYLVQSYAVKFSPAFSLVKVEVNVRKENSPKLTDLELFAEVEKILIVEGLEKYTSINYKVEELEMIEKKHVVELLQSAAYDYQENILSEVDALSEFGDYDDSIYICDAIAEISDAHIPIFDKEIWANASEISEYIEQAIGEGLTDMNAGIVKVLQAGYYQYYNSLLYDNLVALKFNLAVDAVNENIKAKKLVLDIKLLETEIFESLEAIDSDSTFGELEEVIKEIAQRIEDGEFNA